MSHYPIGPVSNTLVAKNALEPVRGDRPAVPGGRQAQVLRLQVALQQLGDALRDTERRERHELRQLQGA